MLVLIPSWYAFRTATSPAHDDAARAAKLDHRGGSHSVPAFPLRGEDGETSVKRAKDRQRLVLPTKPTQPLEETLELKVDQEDPKPTLLATHAEEDGEGVAPTSVPKSQPAKAGVVGMKKITCEVHEAKIVFIGDEIARQLFRLSTGSRPNTNERPPKKGQPPPPLEAEAASFSEYLSFRPFDVHGGHSTSTERIELTEATQDLRTAMRTSTAIVAAWNWVHDARSGTPPEEITRLVGLAVAKTIRLILAERIDAKNELPRKKSQLQGHVANVKDAGSPKGIVLALFIPQQGLPPKYKEAIEAGAQLGFDQFFGKSLKPRNQQANVDGVAYSSAVVGAELWIYETHLYGLAGGEGRMNEQLEIYASPNDFGLCEKSFIQQKASVFRPVHN